MDYEYKLLHSKDMHNRCCAGRVWCVQVSIVWRPKFKLIVSLTLIGRDYDDASLSIKQDICGIICAVMTWLLILYAEFVVMVVIIWPSPYPVYSTINMLIFNLLAVLAYASHLRTMFSDPVSEKSITPNLPIRKLTLIAFPSKWCRAPCRKETPQKKLFSSLASKKAKFFSNVQNAAV